MTQRAELQIGKLFRDLDGSVVHLKSIRNEICVWTAETATCDGAYGGATHMDNFRKRFAPVVEVRAMADVSVSDHPAVAAEQRPIIQAAPEGLSIDDEFSFLLTRLTGDGVQVGQYA